MGVTRIEEVRGFLSTLFGSCEDGWVNLYMQEREPDPDKPRPGARQPVWRHVTEAAELANFIANNRERRDIWVSCCPRRERLPGHNRGGAAHVSVMPCLWVDLDFKHPLHAQDNLPPDWATLVDLHEEFCRRYELDSTFIVHSGHGMQAWYVLQEPLEAKDRRRSELQARWRASWAKLMADYGFAPPDNVFNLDRVMRLPGTRNLKDMNDVVEVELRHADHDMRVEVDLLLDRLEPVPRSEVQLTNLGQRAVRGSAPWDQFNSSPGAAKRVLEMLEIFEPWPSAVASGEWHWKRIGSGNDKGATIYPDGHVTLWSETAKDYWPEVRIAWGYPPFGLLVDTIFRGDKYPAIDWLKEQGFDKSPARFETVFHPPELQRKLKPPAIPGTQWEDPIQFEEPKPELPPFPVRSLPEWAAEHVLAVSQDIQTPVDLAGMCALGVMAAISSRKARIVLGTQYEPPLNLYLATAMDSGEGKSPVFDRMVKPLLDMQAEAFRDHERERLQEETKRAILTKQLKEAQDNAARDPGLARQAKAFELAQELAQMESTWPIQWVADDVTAEALQQVLGRQGGCIALMSDEGGMFDKMERGYGDTVNLDVFLKGHSGGQVIVNRVGRDDVFIPKAIITIAVMTQPAVLRKFADPRYGELHQRGLFNRFMYSMPAPSGRKDKHKMARGQSEVDEVWGEHLRRMVETPEGVTFRLSHAADFVWREWQQKHEDRRQPGGDLEQIREWLAKLWPSVGRLAGILHIAGDYAECGSMEVSEEVMRSAIEIGDYWVEHARYVWHLWTQGSIAPESMASQLLFDLGKAAPPHVPIPLRDLQRVNQRKWKDIEGLRRVLAWLEELGWIRTTGDLFARRSSVTLEIHPEWRRFLENR